MPFQAQIANCCSVVFVHELFAAPVTAWSTPKNITWPRDFLGPDLHDARLWTFGWKTTLFRHCLPLSSWAGNLITELIERRDGRIADQASQIDPVETHRE